MKRNSLILSAALWAGTIAGTQAQAQTEVATQTQPQTQPLTQTETPTLRPDAPQGIALWNDKPRTAPVAEQTPATAPVAEQTPATGLPGRDETHDGAKAAQGKTQEEAATEKSGEENPIGKAQAEKEPGKPAEERATTKPAEEKPGSEVSYIPQILGLIKARFEVSTSSGDQRFNVHNTLFGVKGNASRHIFYQIVLDINNEGKFSVLDTYAGYRTGGFDIRLGQQQYHFSSDLDRGPTCLFANRSFLAKYLTGYYGSDLVDGKSKPYLAALGSRDLGAMATYSFNMFRKRLPLKLFLGAFNGSGINNPQWGNSVNLIGRVEIGGAEGLRVAASYFNGSTPRHNFVTELEGAPVQEQRKQKMEMADAELRYIRGDFFIEGEYARRYLETFTGKDAVMTAALVHSYYRFGLPKRYAMTYIAPMLRWDLGNNVDYINTALTEHQRFDANRITVGINFGFGKKLISSEIRLNYEKYFLKQRPGDFADNKLLQDKFTIEVVAAF